MNAIQQNIFLRQSFLYEEPEFLLRHELQDVGELFLYYSSDGFWVYPAYRRESLLQMSELNRLKAKLLLSHGETETEKYYILFSASGFSEEPKQHAQNGAHIILAE